MTDVSSNETPTDVLRAEHQLILRVTAVVERLIRNAEAQGQFDAAAFGRCVQFLQRFADSCHHAKEEDLLFPVLERCGIPRESGPIGVMLSEHRSARALTQAMASALDDHAKGDRAGAAIVCERGRQYIELIRQHIFKEDHVLYPMGDRAMSGEDQATLCQQFGQAGCRRFGGQSAGELALMVDELEAACGDS